eukprot:CAMPEP_0198249736 /NCGR_PEP_ID=MMETSP1447-20131203/1156_1 /TAXON_ID=420782 /ORGANISM="Chaetoceros dichaeta, Strain CCMP1751" /LENGTH=276 /DNA_ID=CAMNT_0043934429 /DNA_START=28 /DNA_END=858 /DNA_ORIENTATION=+
MPPSNSTVILAAAGSAALLLAARRVYSGSNKTSSALTTTARTENLDPEDCIQADDVIAIFDELFTHMQMVLAQLSQQIQQIQMSGQMIPEKQLREILKAEFDRGLLAKQDAVYEKHDVDEDCLRGATFEMLENEEEYPKVKRAVERLQVLYENVTGVKVASCGPNKPIEALSKEKTMDSATVYFDALTGAMRAVAQKFEKEGLNMKDPAVAQKLQMEFAAVANDIGEAALKDRGVTLDSFKASIEKHQEDPEVGKLLEHLKMKQMQEMSAFGVQAM